MFRDVSDGGIPFRIHLYFTAHSDDDESKPDGKQQFDYLGLGDFFFYNLMLLWIVPPLTSLSTKVAIAMGHVVAVHIGLEASDRLASLYNKISYPALPLPIVAVSIYAFLLDWPSK
jgi:hypothetical protein